MESDAELLHYRIVFNEEFEKHCSNYKVTQDGGGFGLTNPPRHDVGVKHHNDAEDACQKDAVPQGEAK